MTVNLDTIIDIFLKQGLLGAVLVLCLIALYKLTIRYDEVQEKRISEGLENQKIMVELTRSVKELTQTLQNSRGRRA